MAQLLQMSKNKSMQRTANLISVLIVGFSAFMLMSYFNTSFRDWPESVGMAYISDSIYTPHISFIALILSVNQLMLSAKRTGPVKVGKWLSLVLLVSLIVMLWSSVFESYDIYLFASYIGMANSTAVGFILLAWAQIIGFERKQSAQYLIKGFCKGVFFRGSAQLVTLVTVILALGMLIYSW